MSTITEVSKLAGVSLATVSRVMNGTENVREATKEKVLAAMKELGYRPNAAARSLASNKSNSVGMMVSELHGPFYGPMMSGAERAIRTAGKQFLIVASHADEEQEKKAIEYLLSCQCDALILHCETLSDEYLESLETGDTEVILINRMVKSMHDNCLSIDNVQGSFLATEWLIKHKHNNIACLLGPQVKHDARERFWGYQQALAKYNIPFRPELIEQGEFTQDDGYRVANILLNKNTDLTAIICGNDEMAFGAIQAVNEHGLNVPDDISIIGFDDVSFCAMITPTLSSVINPAYDFGVEAASRILKRVYNIEPKFSTSKPISEVNVPDLVIRESVRELE
ncbi:LacI family DNA-binding transcriptional regulator [Algibacillus agarilyticus]|uniref:LacI family DNA-binding transcriptional regulator n=1 Tax=Algibacillus agarilyticus TaxID=2234133 RepID=UPI000DD0B2EF|nr:LacI family DNA-binding transcriptional regulator [Algibacillus agarilyticus]